MRAQGVANAKWAWTTAARNYGSGKPAQYAPNYYPGDEWVDVIAIDAYNMYCKTKTGAWANPWRSLQTIITPFMNFAAQHPGIPLVMAEFGTAEDPANPSAKANWITDARQMFKQPGYERFEAVAYWNTTSHNYANCDFKITSSTASLNAFRAMAADPFYSGQVN
jgi:beta-mannanase